MKKEKVYKAKSRKSYRFKKNTEANIWPGPDQPVLAKLCSDVIVPWGRRVFGARQKMFSNAQLTRPLKQEMGLALWQEISTFMLCFYCETLDPRPQRRKAEIQMFGHNYIESTVLLSGNTAALLQSLRSKSSCLKWHFKPLYCTTPTRVLTVRFLSHYCRSGAAPVLLWMTLNLRNPPLNGICTDFVTLATICKRPSSSHLSGVNPPFKTPRKTNKCTGIQHDGAGPESPSTPPLLRH